MSVLVSNVNSCSTYRVHVSRPKNIMKRKKVSFAVEDALWTKAIRVHFSLKFVDNFKPSARMQTLSWLEIYIKDA